MPMASSWEEFQQKKAGLVEAIKQADGAVALGKTTSNLFRQRQQGDTKRLDVRDFHGVIAVDVAEQTVDVEGMTTYAELVDATLAQGFMPAVVPQLKSITVGGAIAGLGIEATSFHYGLVHETMLEIEVLLGDGSVVVARPDNEYKDLFYGFPNSFGTLGYVLRAKLVLLPVKPYVSVQHLPFANPPGYFQAVASIVQSGHYLDQAVNFLDGVVFKTGEQYLSVGRFVDKAPKTSNYTYTKIYFQSIRQKSVDYLTVKDYIWRWDADWFWCSKNFPGAQNRLVRLLFGKFYLRSTFYWKLMALDQRYGLMRRLDKLTGKKTAYETIIQDIEVPVDKAAEFLDFFQQQIGIKPVWICPLHSYNAKVTYSLYPLSPQKTYINFGFWDTIPSDRPAGHYNRLIEAKVAELGGKKSLYSDSFYTKDQFWQLFDQKTYNTLKANYDPTKRFKELYDKCVKNR